MQTDNSNETQFDLIGNSNNSTITYDYRRCDANDFGSIEGLELH